MLVSPLPSFLGTYSLSTWSKGYKAFLFSVRFFGVFRSYTSRIVPCIIRRRQFRHLSHWWDSCSRVCYRDVFSFTWDTLFDFSFHLRFFDGDRFQYWQEFLIFLFSEHSDFSWLCSSIPSMIYPFPLFIIILTHFSMLHSIHIASLSLFGFPILFFLLLANSRMTSMYFRWLIM